MALIVPRFSSSTARLMTATLRSGLTMAIALLAVPSMTALHDQGCEVGQADPATVNVVDLTIIGGGLYYFEERESSVSSSPPVPLSGFATGRGTWVYQEVNGLPGLQRGSMDGLFCLPREQVCFVAFDDPIIDESCTHGFDHLQVGLWDAPW